MIAYLLSRITFDPQIENELEINLEKKFEKVFEGSKMDTNDKIISRDK